MRTHFRCSTVSVAVLGAAMLLLPATPAVAASGITSPGDGEIFAADTIVPVRAVVEGPVAGPSELSLQAPGSDAAEVVAVQSSPDGGELAYDFDTSCARQLCSGRAPAVNGTWTARLSGAASDERTFVLRIPPVAPTEVAAARAETGVVVRWRLGAEPDLTGYAVEDGEGRTVRGGIGLDACDAEGTCRVELPGDAGAWSVRAFRSACPGCAETLASIASETVQIGGSASGPDGVLPPELGEGTPGAGPAAATPAPGRSGPDQRSAFARAFGPGLPPVAPAAGAPAVPAPQLADGAYDATLGYAPSPDSSRTGSRAQDALDQAAAGDRTSLIIASVLLIGAAWWLRRWARRAIRE